MERHTSRTRQMRVRQLRNTKVKIGGVELRKKSWVSVVYVLFCTILLVSLQQNFTQHKVKVVTTVKAQEEKLITPLVPSLLPTAEAPGTYDSNTSPTQDEIESYIRRIFVEDPDTAVAVSRTECPPSNNLYPQCVLFSRVERSIGVFQINLYNAKQKVHADRIPGTTMQEKEAWLDNPFNNTLYAHWVYSTSGWTPWSTYTSGDYTKNL